MLFRNKSSQSAVEYILIVAFALFMIIPATSLFYKYSSDSQTAIVSSQIFKLGNELMTTSELMYSVGENSWQTIELSFPSNVISAMVYNGTVSELVIRYEDRVVSDVVFFSHNHLFNSTSTDCTDGCILNIHAGLNKVRVESLKDGKLLFRTVE